MPLGSPGVWGLDGKTPCSILQGEKAVSNHPIVEMGE